MMTNPGLPSRFPIQIDFADYTVDQLIQICRADGKGTRLHPDAAIDIQAPAAFDAGEDGLVLCF